MNSFNTAALWVLSNLPSKVSKIKGTFLPEHLNIAQIIEISKISFHQPIVWTFQHNPFENLVRTHRMSCDQ